MLPATIYKNDKKARLLIGIFSLVVFLVVSVLSKYKLNIDAGFNVHILAIINACINSVTAVLLIAALAAVKKHKYQLHKNLMILALALSVLFLISYIAHHLLAGEAIFGDTDDNGVLSDNERIAAGNIRIVYLIILASHILLAALILPLILFTAYRGLTAEYYQHKKLAKYTWPLWLYVAVTGPVVYLMISPYYR